MPTYISGAAGVSQVQDGVITTPKLAASAVTPPKVSGFVVTQSNQTPVPNTSGTLMSFAHGLGAVPVSAELELVCLTADLGYSVGDVVNPWFTNPTYGAPPSIKRNSSIVSATTSNGGIVVMHASTGALAVITYASWAWRFKVRAA